MNKVVLTAHKDGFAVELPQEVVVRLGLSIGANLVLSETPAGLLPSPLPPAGEYASQMAVAERVMREDAETLARLAK